MTVRPKLAVDGGNDGIDYVTLNSLYRDLGLKKPAQFPTKTLSNANYIWANEDGQSGHLATRRISARTSRRAMVGQLCRAA